MMSTPLDWVEPLLAGELDDERAVELERWLDADDANRLLFVQEVQLCRGIRRALLASEDSMAIEEMHSDEHSEAWAEVVEMALASRRQQEREAQSAVSQNADQSDPQLNFPVASQAFSQNKRRPYTLVIPIPVAVIGLAAAVFFIALIIWPGQTTSHPDETPTITRRSSPATGPGSDPAAIDSPQNLPAIASIQQTNNPQWGRGHGAGGGAAMQPDAAGRMSPGPYHLASGDVELRLDRGVVLLVEGPAEFELLDDNTTRLISGNLTATITQMESAFHLETPTARFEVTDALYGIHVGASGDTQAYVFSGEVAVASHSAVGSSQPMQFRRREGVVVDSRTVQPQRTEVVPEQFALELSALTGKPVVTGQADYLRSMPETVIMNHGPQSPRAWIAMESTNRILQRGTASAQGYPERTRVFTQSGRRVDSYLVVFDPEDETNEFKTAQFEATFPGRVLTVIAEDDDLSESHGWYGDSETQYERFGTAVDGLESTRVGINPEFRSDTIELSEDGRTMKVFLGAHNGADVFRVLVERPRSVGFNDRADADCNAIGHFGSSSQQLFSITSRPANAGRDDLYAPYVRSVYCHFFPKIWRKL